MESGTHLDLYLFRHGYTRYNLEKRYQGRSDLPLAEGEAERIRPFRFAEDGVPGACREPVPELILDLSSYLTAGRNPEISSGGAVYVSPALRARQTADLLFPGIRQIVIPEFQEMDFGVFEGRSADEMEKDPRYRSWVDSMCEDPVPGGESRAQFTGRVAEGFIRLAAQSFREGCRRLVIVAHGGVQMAVMDHFCSSNRPYWSWQTAPAEAVRARIEMKLMP